MPTGPLGFVTVPERTTRQHDAHAQALAGMAPLAQYALPVPQLAPGQKVCLYDSWKAPEVVADVGFPFDRIHQITGSCVWAGGTNALFSTIAMQRLVSDNPTTAFLPFTLHNYALSRHYMGDDGQGEGSMGSTFAKSLASDGVRDWPKGGGDGLPTWSDQDGISVTERDEYQWSSVRNSSIQTVLSTSRQHLIGSAAPCRNPEDVKAAILNGYGVSFACNNYIGDAHVQGEGENACVVGYWNGRGGHQQSVHACWEHPTLGPLFFAQNNWPGSTYPRDPAGGPICGCWVTLAHLEAAFRLDSEVFALSHLAWFAAQPRVLDWGKL